jgi:hypothetical protein
MFDKEWLFDLERKLTESKNDSDLDSFCTIRKRLSGGIKLTPDEFARQCIYVILAGGFSQTTAKKKHSEIMNYLESGGNNFNDLIKIFGNKNKINAIIKIWQGRERYCAEYIKNESLKDKLNYLSTLPHIGKITANHLARNLGENIVKYDIWIQRLGLQFANRLSDEKLIDNGNLNPKIKKYCDDMFDILQKKTNYPIGYIDVILWKSCQQGFIKLK